MTPPEPPLVSVLLAVYNGERYVAAAVESVLAQTYGRLELIVIDDGSTDGTLAILKGFEDPRVRLVSRENRGLVTTLAEAASLARGTYLARMDADDLSRRDRLARQVQFLESHPDVVLVGSDYTLIDEHGSPVHVTSFLAHPHDLKTAQVVGNQFGHGCVLMRADAYAAVGGYDTGLPQAEDMDLWSRLSHVGEVANLPEPLYAYRDNPDGISSTQTDEQRAYALALRDRAFAHFLAHRRSYRVLGYHPGSTRGSLRDYHERRAMVLRDLAWLHLRAGRRVAGTGLLLAAAAFAPWASKTYRCFAGVASPRLRRRWAYEHL
ncbi:glycosyltransferase [Motilibacter deserti]|uniref:Glycosyltransferase n=1 Tax=Motilibacter deserti TaxID=2714956 RepID=A0ABX0GTS8_9ACTN|nr:glycosyltransferase [Motilibacter deserti]